MIGLFLAVFTIALATACSPVSTSGKGGEESNDLPDDPGMVTPPTITSGTESYFKISSTEGYVTRSSELKFENGSCFLSNLYDFPDDIFGDNSLDNLTTTPLNVNSCRRLAIAESIRTASAGACTPSSFTLTNAEKAQIGVDPAKLGLTGVSATDLQNFATTLELSASCVCSVAAVAPIGGLSASLSLPPAIDLCTQKFPVYSAANLAAALAQINALYGIP